MPELVLKMMMVAIPVFQKMLPPFCHALQFEKMASYSAEHIIQVVTTLLPHLSAAAFPPAHTFPLVPLSTHQPTYPPTYPLYPHPNAHPYPVHEQTSPPAHITAPYTPQPHQALPQPAMPDYLHTSYHTHTPHTFHTHTPHARTSELTPPPAPPHAHGSAQHGGWAGGGGERSVGHGVRSSVGSGGERAVHFASRQPGAELSAWIQQQEMQQQAKIRKSQLYSNLIW